MGKESSAEGLLMSRDEKEEEDDEKAHEGSRSCRLRRSHSVDRICCCCSPPSLLLPNSCPRDEDDGGKEDEENGRKGRRHIKKGRERAIHQNKLWMLVEIARLFIWKATRLHCCLPVYKYTTHIQSQVDQNGSLLFRGLINNVQTFGTGQHLLAIGPAAPAFKCAPGAPSSFFTQVQKAEEAV